MKLIRTALLVISPLLLAGCSDPYQEAAEESLKLNNLEFRELAAHYSMCAITAAVASQHNSDLNDDVRVFHYNRLVYGMVFAKVCSGSISNIIRLSCLRSFSSVKGEKNFPESKREAFCGKEMDKEVAYKICPNDKLEPSMSLIISMTDSTVKMLNAQIALTDDEESVAREYYAKNCSYE